MIKLRLARFEGILIGDSSQKLYIGGWLRIRVGPINFEEIMILSGKDRFIKGEYFESPFGWVGCAQSSGNYRDNPELTKIHQELIDNRSKVEVIGGVVDQNLSYQYDEFALVRWKRKLYLLETSGCSCPSPSETWGIVHGPIGKAALRKEIKSGNYRGYTLPSHLEEELLKVIDEA